MRIASTIDATGLQHDGVDYEPDEHGIFEVPHEVGQALVRFPHWVEEHVAQAAATLRKAEHDRDPQQLAARVEDLEAKLADALALVDKLTAAQDNPAAAADAAAQVAEDVAAAVEPRKAAAKKAGPKKATDPAPPTA